MIRILLKAALFLTLSVFIGCGPVGTPLHFICLPDFSASVDSGSVDIMLEQIMKQAERFHRGDSLTVIPITGDAEVDVHGLVLHLQLPRERTAYDHDLTERKRAFRDSLDKLRALALQKRFAQSDIIGTVSLAAQEFAIDPPRTSKELVILSDFIHEEADLNFQTSPALANKNTARSLATKLAVQSQSFQHVRVLLAETKSPVIARLSKSRRAAIREFWMAFFERQSTKPIFTTESELAAPIAESVQ